MAEINIEQVSQAFKKAKPAVIDEINRQAEVFLSAQLEAALAADQRALVYASIVSAVLAILIGALATVAASGGEIGQLLLCIIPMTACLIVALFFALAACKPVDFRSGGNNPRQWLEDIASAQSLADSKAETAALYTRAIEENMASMGAGADNLKVAMRWGAIALVVGATAFVLVYGDGAISKIDSLFA